MGKCEYGVLARPKQTPFLLRYYPKAVAGNPDELNRADAPAGNPVRDPANLRDAAASASDKPASGRIRLVALRNGKPIPNAVFTAIDSDLSEQTIKAGPDGICRLDSPCSGPLLGLCPRNAQAARHSAEIKKYDEIREFATLAFTWPLEQPRRRPRGGRTLQGGDRSPRRYGATSPDFQPS